MRKMYSKKQIERIAKDVLVHHEVIISTQEKNDFYIYPLGDDNAMTDVVSIPDGFYVTVYDSAVAAVEISGDSVFFTDSNGQTELNVTGVADQL